MPGTYEAIKDAGDLVLLGGRVVPVGPFLAEAVRRYGRPKALAADRWRAGELEDGVRGAGLHLPEPTWRGQGWRDGSVDVRLFRSATLPRAGGCTGVPGDAGSTGSKPRR